MYYNLDMYQESVAHINYIKITLFVVKKMKFSNIFLTEQNNP